MPDVTIKQIRDALRAVLITVTPTNGYVPTIAADHFYDLFDNTVVGRQQESKFPKFFIVTEGGFNTKLPTGRQLCRLIFLLIVVVKTMPTESLSAREQLEVYIDAVDKAIKANDTLGGTVQDAVLTQYQTDSGNLHPEGAAVLRIEVEYFKQI